ncbi:MAG: YidC/Oxa1 family membrane protein insertase [Brevinema sp.]
MLNKGFLLSLLLLSIPYFTAGQELKYSNSQDTNEYTISAPDHSSLAIFSPKGGRAVSFSINGSWNRLSNDILISDRLGQLSTFDFHFGTYTSLVTNDLRPVYRMEASSNKIMMSTSATVEGKQLNLIRVVELLSNGQVLENLSISNTTTQNVELNFEGLAFSFASLFDISRATTNRNNIPEYQYFNGDKLQKVNLHGGSWFGGPKPAEFLSDFSWGTIADNFFLTLIQPNFSNTVVVYNGLEFGAQSRVSLGIQVLATNITSNQVLDYQTVYYVGPRTEQMVQQINTEYTKLFKWPFVFNWMLKPIENGTIWLMSKLVETTGSAGLTLILIAIVVKLLLLPLSFKSAVSMKKMRVLQPKLNKLQEKWGHDPQVLQQKTMELYKSEKVNPLGGCLPLLFQIPVFFALFRVLSRSVELRGAGFLWITDLTMPDVFFMIGSFTIHLLPIIMTLLQLVSVFLQQGRMGDSQNAMQKQMQVQGYLMPVIFLFLFWGMPSGLVLYWTVQNVFSIIEQEFINIDSRFSKKSI